MSVILLQPGRSIPLSLLLDSCGYEKTDAELRTEAFLLTTEIGLIKEPSAWQFKKGWRLIEIGTLLMDHTFVTIGRDFLLSPY